MNTTTLSAAIDEVTHWLSWIADHNFPAVVFAVAVIILVLIELRRPGA